MLNLGSIAAATIAALAFAAVFLAVVGRPARATGGLVAVAVIAVFWLASILAGALILAPPRGSPWLMALGSAVVIWIGFVVPALAASYRLRGLTWRSVATDCALWLGIMLVEAAVMRALGLVAPG